MFITIFALWWLVLLSGFYRIFLFKKKTFFCQRERERVVLKLFLFSDIPACAVPALATLFILV